MKREAMPNKSVSGRDSPNFDKATPRPPTVERTYREKEIIFPQGDSANALFAIRAGTVKLMVTANNGRRAVPRIMGAGEIFGEECLSRGSLRNATAVALEPSVVTQVLREGVLRAIRGDPAFACEFVTHLLTRLEQSEEELADQILYSSEQRLARVLWMMSNLRPGSNWRRSPHTIDQNTLAEMVGTTRSRVSFFMNRFRKLGLIDYNGSLHVYPALVEFLDRH